MNKRSKTGIQLGRRTALLATGCLAGSALLAAPAASAGTTSHVAVVQVSGHAASATGDSPFASCDVAGESFGPGDVNHLNSESGALLAVNPTDPSNVIAAYEQDYWFSTGARGAVTAVSHDGGATWRASIPHFSVCAGGTPANGGNLSRAGAPRVTFASNGDAYVVDAPGNAVHDMRTAILVAKSTDGGSTWSEPVQLANEPLFGSGYVNNRGAEIVGDPSNPNIVYVSWQREHSRSDNVGWSAEGSFPHRRDTPLVDEMFTRTTDGGHTWEPVRIIYQPHTGSSGFHRLVALPGGALVDLLERVVGNPQRGDKLELAIIRSSDRGVTWSAPASAFPWHPLGNRDPDTGLGISWGNVAVTADLTPGSPGFGNLHAVFHNASPSGGENDIMLVTSTDGGKTWSRQVRVDKSPAGVDALLPSVAVAAHGTLGVGYYDFRTNTAAPGAATDVWFTHCHPGSDCSQPSSWQEVHIGGPFDIERGPTCPVGLNIGFTMGLQAVGDRFLALFAQTTGTDPLNQYLAVIAP
jgi:hypothetical protein